MFRRRAFENELTRQLDRGDVKTVEQLLCSDGLSGAVSSDAQQVIKFLSEDDPIEDRPRKEIVVDWALTKKYNHADLDKTYRNYQVNRNATTMIAGGRSLLGSLVDLENPGKSYLLTSLMNFLDQDISNDAIFAGHWSTLAIKVLYLTNGSFKSLGFDHNTVITKCLEKIDVLAYQTFLNEILPLVARSEDFGADSGSNPVFQQLMLQILTRAARHVMVSPVETKIFACATLTRKISSVLNPEEVNQPPASTGGKIPLPYYAQCPRNRGFENPLLDNDDYNERRKARYEVLMEGVEKAEEYEDNSEMKAYLLLMSVAKALEDDESFLSALRTRECMRHLFICGIYGGEFSMATHWAFKILNWLINGRQPPTGRFEDESLEIVGPSPSELEVANALVSEFAQDCFFDRELTPRMVAAFPVFWNCQYTTKHMDCQREDHKVEYFYCDSPDDLVFPVTPLVTGPNQETFSTPTTPFELYSCELVYEPPVSDSLNFEILRRIRLLEEQSKSLRSFQRSDFEGKDFKAWIDRQKELTDKYDMVWLRFLLTKFMYTKDREVNMHNVKELLPYVPEINKDWKDLDVAFGSRAALNGYILELCMFMIKSQMLMFNGQPTPLQHLPDTPKILDADVEAIVNRYTLLVEDFYNRAQPITVKPQPMEEPDFPWSSCGEPDSLLMTRRKR